MYSTTNLIPIGFFRELPHGDPRGPSLLESTSSQALPDQQQLVAYLRGGAVWSPSPHGVVDVLDRSVGVVGTATIRTDGTHTWPDDLAHYVARYNVRVPDAFRAHAAANGFQVPQGIGRAPQSLPPVAYPAPGHQGYASYAPPPRPAPKTGGTGWVIGLVAGVLIVGGGASAAVVVATKKPEAPCKAATPAGVWASAPLSKLLPQGATFCEVPAAEASTHAKVWMPVEVRRANLDAVELAQQNGWDRLADNWYSGRDHTDSPKWSELKGTAGKLRIDVHGAGDGAMIELKVDDVREKRDACKALAFPIVAHEKIKGRKEDELRRDLEKLVASLSALQLKDAKVEEFRTRFVKHEQEYLKLSSASADLLKAMKQTPTKVNRKDVEGWAAQQDAWKKDDKKIIGDIDAYCTDVLEGEDPPK